VPSGSVADAVRLIVAGAMSVRPAVGLVRTLVGLTFAAMTVTVALRTIDSPVADRAVNV
jgi:hypothetical protein